jgi:hypothetical protein
MNENSRLQLSINRLERKLALYRSKEAKFTSYCDQIQSAIDRHKAKIAENNQVQP